MQASRGHAADREVERLDERPLLLQHAEEDARDERDDDDADHPPLARRARHPLRQLVQSRQLAQLSGQLAEMSGQAAGRKSEIRFSLKCES